MRDSVCEVRLVGLRAHRSRDGMNPTSPLIMNTGMHRSTAAPLVCWWVGYLAFVVYGSLVPLDYRPIPWEQAWTSFQNIRLLNVGAEGRADWVANGVLYLPVGFLTACVFSGRRRHHLTAVLGAVLFASALAVTVEFSQLAFPPRTVSLNDLLAEFIGSGVGAGLAGVAGHRVQALFAAWAGKGERLVFRGLVTYALAYGAFSLFPFDFLVSFAELSEKLGSGNWGWTLAGIGGGNVVVAVVKLTAESLAAVPLGALLIARGRSARQAFGAGLALGVAVELAQLFLVSGVSQGLSVLTRGFGVLAGALVWERRAKIDLLYLGEGIRRHAIAATTLYLIAIAAITGWFDRPLRNLAGASQAFGDVHFLPLYYHYYTTEQAALLSLVSVGLMYAPIGVLGWASFLGGGMAAGLAVMLAATVEGSKLFLNGLHPDPTNLLLAGIAAWLSCRLVQQVERLARHAGSRSVENSASPVTGVDPAVSESGEGALSECQSAGQGRGEIFPMGAEGPGSLAIPGWPALLGLAVAVGVAAYGVVTFPVAPWLLSIGLGVYGLALWWRPRLLWLVVPAALPLLDLAPWSGRYFFDEFDFLLLLSIGVGYARIGPLRERTEDQSWRLVLALVVLAYGTATLRGLLPWQGLDANTFSHYYSSFNALRIAKGVGWALLLVILARRFAAAGVDVVRHVGQGLVLGLTGTVAVVIWERWAFPGLFNFTDVYRVTGPFSQMHIGGADLECYLTMAVPFLVVMLFERRSWLERSIGLALLAASTYAVMVTFSRAAFLGLGVAVLLSAGLNEVKPSLLSGTAPFFRRAWAAAMLALVAIVAAPVLIGAFAQERLASAGKDFDVRLAHWRDALAIRDPGLETVLFGMGLGRFPVTHFWRSEEPRAASYQIGKEGEDSYLRLGTGSPLYVEQFVNLQVGRDYTLRLRAHTPDVRAHLSVSLCEKWLLTSARCEFGALEVPGGNWRELSVNLRAGEMGSEPWYQRRPIKLSLYNAGHGGLVEVDDLSLRGSDGQELLANGDFSQGMDQWFFSVDVDLPWHIWSLPVGVLFEMGWLGVLALGLAFFLGLVRSSSLAWSGAGLWAAMLGALTGFVALGTVDSLLDSPRLLLLILLLFGLSSGATRSRIG